MKQIFGLLFFIQLCLYADASYWNDEQVCSYAHHSELQRRWAWSFLAPYLRDVPTDFKILDIGCGDGKITADLAKFVPHGSIVGIDLSEAMLAWARKQYHPLEYPNLSFQKGNFLAIDVSNQVDWVVSFCAFQHCSDQKKALSKISQILKPDGKLLILVPAMNNSPWNQALLNLQASPKWDSYWRDFSPRKFGTIQRYSDLLATTGFRILKIENMPTEDPFVDLEEILNWLEGTFPPVIPKNQIRAFYTELVQEYLRLDPTAVDEQGVIYARFGVIGIEAVLNSK